MAKKWVAGLVDKWVLRMVRMKVTRLVVMTGKSWAFLSVAELVKSSETSEVGMMAEKLV